MTRRRRWIVAGSMAAVAVVRWRKLRRLVLDQPNLSFGQRGFQRLKQTLGKFGVGVDTVVFVPDRRGPHRKQIEFDGGIGGFNRFFMRFAGAAQLPQCGVQLRQGFGATRGGLYPAICGKPIHHPGALPTG